MHVGIDEPRKNGGVAEIMDFIAVRRDLLAGNNSLDALALYQYGRWPDSFGSDHSGRSESL
jgi:hypothetical protein